MSISIAPLQGDYSEVLPIPVRQKGKLLDEHKRVRKNPREQAQCQRWPIPERGANNCEGTILLSCCAGRWDEKTPLSRAEISAI